MAESVDIEITEEQMLQFSERMRKFNRGSSQWGDDKKREFETNCNDLFRSLGLEHRLVLERQVFKVVLRRNPNDFSEGEGEGRETTIGARETANRRTRARAPYRRARAPTAVDEEQEAAAPTRRNDWMDLWHERRDKAIELLRKKKAEERDSYEFGPFGAEGFVKDLREGRRKGNNLVLTEEDKERRRKETLRSKGEKQDRSRIGKESNDNMSRDEEDKDWGANTEEGSEIVGKIFNIDTDIMDLTIWSVAWKTIIERLRLTGENSLSINDFLENWQREATEMLGVDVRNFNEHEFALVFGGHLSSFVLAAKDGVLRPSIKGTNLPRKDFVFHNTLEGERSQMKGLQERLAKMPKASGETHVDISNDDIEKQMSSIRAEAAVKIPYVGEKEPLSALEADYVSSPIVLQKIKMLSGRYPYIRRTSPDGNCFFRGFVFAYLEHILDSKDAAEVDRVKASIKQYEEALDRLGDRGLIDLFGTVLDSLLGGSEHPIASPGELIERSREAAISYYAVLFVRHITSAEIRQQWDLFKSFLHGNPIPTADEFCKKHVERMNEESDEIQIKALSEALGVAIRVEYLDQSDGAAAKQYEFGSSNVDFPVTLLYQPGHYDILCRS